MDDKISYLSKYRKGVTLVGVDEVEKSMIPSQWYEILCEKDINTKIKNVISLWKQFCESELRVTISYFSKNLLDIDIIKYKNEFSILYSLRMGDGEIDYYEGKLPSIQITGKLESFWSQTPKSIKNFYENVHDGFYYFPSMAMGVISLERVKNLSEDEWGIIDRLKEPLQINLETAFDFFSTGMGGYVVIDYSNLKDENATIWFVDDEPIYNKFFWDVVDEWIVMGFE